MRHPDSDVATPGIANFIATVRHSPRTALLLEKGGCFSRRLMDKLTEGSALQTAVLFR
jgi:hypothetical protein